MKIVFCNLVSVQEFVDPYVGIRIFPPVRSCKWVTIFFYVYIYLWSWFAHPFFKRSLFFKDQFKLLFVIFENCSWKYAIPVATFYPA